MADEVLAEYHELGFANTPTAGGAVRMVSQARLVNRDDAEVVLILDLHTENSAMFDNCTGVLRVALMKGPAPVSSYTITTPRNPGRGFQGATQRDNHTEQDLPKNLAFDSLGFTFYNQDHFGPEMLNINNISKTVGVAKSVVDIIKSIGGHAALRDLAVGPFLR